MKSTCNRLLATGLISAASASAISPRNYPDECVPAAPLALITPCPTCEVCTVTRQNQPVSTWIPQYAIKQANGDYQTFYSTHHYNWISTVVPCAVAPYYATVTNAGQYVTVASKPQYAVETLDCSTPGVYEINGTPTYVSQPTVIHYQTSPRYFVEALPFKNMPEYYHLIGQGVPESWSQPVRQCQCPQDYTTHDDCECNQITRYISTHEQESEYVVAGYPVVIDHQFDRNGQQEFEVGGVNIVININNALTHYHHTTHVPPHTVTTTTTVTSTTTDSQTTSAPTGVPGAPFVLGIVHQGPVVNPRSAGRFRHKHRRDLGKRAVTGYVTHSGDNFIVASDINNAATFRLNGAPGNLLTDATGNTLISCSSDEVVAGFGKLTQGASDDERFDDTFQRATNGFITWQNPIFTDGFANFCVNPVDQVIYEIFGGIQPSGFTCNNVQLQALPVPTPPISSPPSTSEPTSAPTTSASSTSSSATDSSTTDQPTTTSSSSSTDASTSTSSSSTSSSSGSSQPSDIAEVLNKHNALRAIHGAPAMTWDTTVAAFAQSVADKCLFEHTTGNAYGENLASGQTSWTEVVQDWYDEIKDYDYNNPGFSSATGHFTQVVWSSSIRLGCGFKVCPGLQFGNLWVCEYDPPGNIDGQFPDNVKRPVAQ